MAFTFSGYRAINFTIVGNPTKQRFIIPVFYGSGNTITIDPSETLIVSTVVWYSQSGDMHSSIEVPSNILTKIAESDEFTIGNNTYKFTFELRTGLTGGTSTLLLALYQNGTMSSSASSTVSYRSDEAFNCPFIAFYTSDNETYDFTIRPTLYSYVGSAYPTTTTILRSSNVVLPSEGYFGLTSVTCDNMATIANIAPPWGNQISTAFYNGGSMLETDPYAKGGSSSGGGGKGKFSRTGDTIGEHDLPTLSAVDAGFITLFAPSAGEMKSLSNYLWGPLFSIDTFKKIFANPMDCILGLSIVPVEVPKGGSQTIHVGNIDTGVSMTKASTQYVKVSCGSLSVEEYWGAYLDYAPYTKCEIYLPYIGVHSLAIEDVMDKTVKVVYYVDILSGACVAEIYSNGTCLYSFSGQCSSSIPITGNDWTNVINGVMQVAGAAIAGIATGGLSAPIGAAGIAGAAKGISAASSTVAASKPAVERSGNLSGTGGMLGQQRPYLIITWPKECIPAGQNKFIGYPSYTTQLLGDLEGYNVIDSVHLEGIPATGDELDEIERMLTEGVIF